MKKETLQSIILWTVGGMVFAFGMCMCLIEEWNLFKPGVAVTSAGVIILLFLIPIYRKTHPKKEHKPVEKGMILSFVIGLVGIFSLGAGMALSLAENAGRNVMIGGIILGLFGLML